MPDAVAQNEISVSDQHCLLASVWRRRILEVLETIETPIRLEDLASKVATMEDSNIDDTMVILHHTHLPMMSQMKVIKYDEKTRVVRIPT